MHTDQSNPAELARLASEIARYALGKSGTFYGYKALDDAACEAQGLLYGTVLLTPAPPQRDADHSLDSMYADDAHDLLVSANEALGAHPYLTVDIARRKAPGGEGLLAVRGPWYGLHLNVEHYVQAQADLFARDLTARIDERTQKFVAELTARGGSLGAALGFEADTLLSWEAERDLWRKLAEYGDMIGVLAEALVKFSGPHCDAADPSLRYVRIRQSEGVGEFLRRARTRPGYSAEEALHAMLNKRPS